MSFAFVRDPGERTREEWRALDRAVYRWVRAHGGSALLAATAAWASLADGDGDAALPLTEVNRYGFPPPAPDEVERLRAEPMVAGADAAAPRPFVIDAAARFYLWRNFVQERAAAAAIRARRSAPPTPAHAERAAIDADLDALFGGEPADAIASQCDAVRGGVGRRIVVLTGGPGTGKTTTVLRMLLMLQRRAGRALAIACAAPTGKAAQRLAQALRRGKRELRERALPLPAPWQPLLDAIPDDEALTVHRLLGYQPWRNAFRRGRRDPLGADVVVVDEASMLDLAMLRSVLDAVRDDATLVLVGDADQLASVATGSVLMDIVAAFEADARGDLLRLRHSFRAERTLVALNEAVRAGNAADMLAAMPASEGDVGRHGVDTPRALADRLRAWARELGADAALRPVLPALPADAAAAAAADAGARRTALARAALQSLARRQLLCALRETPFGSVAVNVAIERTLREAWQVPTDSEWYAGRAIIVTRNDYAAGLFNGDVGLCLVDEAGRRQVWFEAAPGRGSAEMRAFAPNALPLHESAFAITIHKSQGSEYAEIAVVLPPDADNRILSRQLLYTAVSRARRRVELWATDVVLRAALGRPIARQGGLRERLAETTPGQAQPPRADVAAPTAQLKFEF